MFTSYKYSSYCWIETWLLQGPICQQFSLFSFSTFATNSFEINCGVLSDITLQGGHRKKIILLTIIVIVLWSDPLLDSVGAACVCAEGSRCLWSCALLPSLPGGSFAANCVILPWPCSTAGISVLPTAQQTVPFWWFYSAPAPPKHLLFLFVFH